MKVLNWIVGLSITGVVVYMIAVLTGLAKLVMSIDGVCNSSGMYC